MEGSIAQRTRAAEIERWIDEEPQKKCSQCGASKTPLWRRGPTGMKTLCNACGLRFKNREKAWQRGLNMRINNDMKKRKRGSKIGNGVSLEKKLMGLANKLFSHRPPEERLWMRLSEEEQVAVLLMSFNA